MDKKIPSEMLTVSEAATALGVHTNTLRRWAKGGLIREYRYGAGKHRRFKMEDIQKFLDEGAA